MCPGELQRIRLMWFDVARKAGSCEWPYLFLYWDILLAQHCFVYVPMIADKVSMQEAANIEDSWINSYNKTNQMH